MICAYCGSSKFRTSRIKINDLIRLLLFQLPVRCRSCHERDYAGFMLASNLRQAEKVRRNETQQSKRRRPKTADTNESS